jgi:hypothetical protein
VEPVTAHPAIPAGDVEWDHDSVADAELGDPGADLLDDSHRFVPEHVSGIQIRREHGIEMQVGAAQAGARDADDDVVGLLDGRVRDGVDADVAGALPGKSSHAPSLPLGARAQRGMMIGSSGRFLLGTHRPWAEHVLDGLL